MVSLIQCRTNQVRHTGIYYGKLLCNRFLHICHSRNQRATLSHKRATKLEMQLLSIAQLHVVLKHIKECLEIGNGIVVRIAIINAQTSTNIYRIESHAFCLKLILKAVVHFAQHLIRLKVGELRPNVVVQAFQANCRQTVCQANHIAKQFKINAKLVVAQPGGNVAMGVSIDVRVHSNCHVGYLAFRQSQIVNHAQFGLRLDVEACDVVVECIFNFAVGFSNTGKHNFVAGKSGFNNSLHLPTALDTSVRRVIIAFRIAQCPRRIGQRLQIEMLEAGLLLIPSDTQ